MKKNGRIILSIMLVLFLCASMLSGCDFDIFSPSRNQTPSDPAIDDPSNPGNPTNPDQDQTPSDPVDNGGDDAPTGPDVSDKPENPTSPEGDDSSIMDGDDHLEFPFG